MLSTLPPSPEQVELARRILATRKMLHFTKFTFPKYLSDPFHQAVASALDEVVAHKIQRLMIFAPPQHGKSELVSTRLPAFWLAQNPDLPVILTSYGGSLAFRNSRSARTVVESEEFRTLFPEIRTDPDSRAVDRWKVHHHRGFVVAAGVGGPITGHGAGLGIIDDPVQSWAQAQSETFRDSVWEWFRGTFRTRIWEGGSIVLIMTRWHQDDLAGRILSEQREQWKVLHFPAVCDDEVHDVLGRKEGEPLSPTRFSKLELDAIRADVGPSVWTAEYQGRPAPPEGSFFQVESIDYLQEEPEEFEAIVRYWDLAATEAKMGRDPDYTVGYLMGKKKNDFVSVDVLRARLSPLTVKEEVVKAAYRDRAKYGQGIKIRIEQEPGSAGKSLVAEYVALLAGFDVKGIPATGQKTVRAQPWASQVEAGHVKFVIANWNNPAIDELRYFPSGVHDDIVDAGSGAFNELALGPKWRVTKFLHLGLGLGATQPQVTDGK